MAEPQGGAVTVGCVAAPVLLLDVSSMAGGDSVDGTTLWCFLKHATDMRMVLEEEERRKQEEKEKEDEQNDAMVRAQLGATHSSSWYQGKKEEKRRRKKRKLPKTFARAPLCRRQAQMVGIMAGLGQMDRYVVFVVALFVDNGIGMYLAGFPGDAAPRAVLLCCRLAQDAPQHGRYAPE